MPQRTRRSLLIVGFAFPAALALAAWWILPGRRAEVRRVPVPTETAPLPRPATGPFHLQTDPRWANERLGGSGEPLRQVGCTLCCLSMALSHLGMPLDPAQLNRRLKEVDGFTRRGWVKWDAIRQISEGRIHVVIPRDPTHREIDTALAEGHPVLVKVIVPSGFQHWVLLVGRDGGEYLMKDPLGDGRTLRPLSSIDSDILAVRVVKKR